MPQEVAKENQQYRLCLQYEYIGSSEQGNKLLKKDLEEFNEILPMGYTAKSEDNNWSWGGKDNKQYRLLLIVIAIIFYYEYTVQFFETAIGNNFCDSGILYRRVSDILLVQIEF